MRTISQNIILAHLALLFFSFIHTYTPLYLYIYIDIYVSNYLLQGLASPKSVEQAGRLEIQVRVLSLREETQAEFLYSNL